MSNKYQEEKLNQLIAIYESSIQNRQIFQNVDFKYENDNGADLSNFYKKHHGELVSIRTLLINKEYDKAHKEAENLMLPNQQNTIVKNVIEYYNENMDLDYDVQFGLEEFNYGNINNTQTNILNAESINILEQTLNEITLKVNELSNTKVISLIEEKINDAISKYSEHYSSTVVDAIQHIQTDNETIVTCFESIKKELESTNNISNKNFTTLENKLDSLLNRENDNTAKISQNILDNINTKFQSSGFNTLNETITNFKNELGMLKVFINNTTDAHKISEEVSKSVLNNTIASIKASQERITSNIHHMITDANSEYMQTHKSAIQDKLVKIIGSKVKTLQIFALASVLILLFGVVANSYVLSKYTVLRIFSIAAEQNEANAQAHTKNRN